VHIEKVLVLFPLKDGQTGPAFVKAFQDCGIQVSAFDTNVETEATILKVVKEFDGQLIFMGREPILATLIEEIRKLN